MTDGLTIEFPANASKLFGSRAAFVVSVIPAGHFAIKLANHRVPDHLHIFLVEGLILLGSVFQDLIAWNQWVVGDLHRIDVNLARLVQVMHVVKRFGD